MNTAIIRIMVCVAIAGMLMFISLNSLSSNPLSILSLGVGALVLIFAFSKYGIRYNQGNCEDSHSTIQVTLEK